MAEARTLQNHLGIALLPTSRKFGVTTIRKNLSVVCVCVGTKRLNGAHLGACVDLPDEEVDADVCDTREEFLAFLRVLEQPRLGLLERF